MARWRAGHRPSEARSAQCNMEDVLTVQWGGAAPHMGAEPQRGTVRVIIDAPRRGHFAQLA